MPMSQFIAEDSKRPKLDVLKMTRAFLEVARYLEDNDDEQITINDLIDFMNQKLLIKLIVTPSPMKTKLQEHRTTARVVLQDYYSKHC